MPYLCRFRALQDELELELRDVDDDVHLVGPFEPLELLSPDLVLSLALHAASYLACPRTRQP